jgi:L-erythro-3,5-diaminohexanoate dehydrogenase
VIDNPRLDDRKPCRFGSHRVLEPSGALPQNAWKLDARPIAQGNEILCDVDALNIDSASFRNIADACGNDPGRVAEHIVALVAERGKHHNPATGSGGIFIGRVRTIGAALRERCTLHEGQRIASLVSLTLTPLQIDQVLRVDMATGQVWVRGTAILFECSAHAALPDDIPGDVALAVLDVAGAPAQVRRLAQPGQTIAVFGADGKSGMLSVAQARERVGAAGRVIGIAPDAETPGARLLLDHGYLDAFVAADARDSLAVADKFAALAPDLADLTVNCVNVAGTEPASILCTKDGGTIYFFSMCTSFTAAALGAEGLGKDVTMIVGNGYAPNHAATSLETLRNHPALYAHFMERYGTRTPRA